MTRTEAVAYLQDLANRLHGESEYVVEATATLLRTGDNVQQILSECTLLELCRAMAIRCDSLSVLATLRPEEGTEEPYKYVAGSAHAVLGLLETTRVALVSQMLAGEFAEGDDELEEFGADEDDDSEYGSA